MLFLAGAAILTCTQAGFGSVINFDDQGLTGPSTFGAAGPAQVHTITVDGVTATFTGGVILENTTNLPANQTALYGTANFGTGLSNPLTITFSQPITNFFLNVYNGLTTNIDYVVSDNAGNSSMFNLQPNLSSGQTLIGFAATGTEVTIFSASRGGFDFFIDNIRFDEPLPPELGGVPEPGSFALLGGGMVGTAFYLIRKRKSQQN